MSEPAKPAAFVVIPEFVVKPDCLDAFLALARDDARHSLADEPGCRQFDIVQMDGLYRPRIVRHRIESYAATAAGESWFCRTAAGV